MLLENFHLRLTYFIFHMEVVIKFRKKFEKYWVNLYFKNFTPLWVWNNIELSVCIFSSFENVSEFLLFQKKIQPNFWFFWKKKKKKLLSPEKWRVQLHEPLITDLYEFLYVCWHLNSISSNSSNNLRNSQIRFFCWYYDVSFDVSAIFKLTLFIVSPLFLFLW